MGGRGRERERSLLIADPGSGICNPGWRVDQPVDIKKTKKGDKKKMKGRKTTGKGKDT